VRRSEAGMDNRFVWDLRQPCRGAGLVVPAPIRSGSQSGVSQSVRSSADGPWRRRGDAGGFQEQLDCAEDRDAMSEAASLARDRSRRGVAADPAGGRSSRSSIGSSRAGTVIRSRSS